MAAHIDIESFISVFYPQFTVMARPVRVHSMSFSRKNEKQKAGYAFSFNDKSYY